MKNSSSQTLYSGQPNYMGFHEEKDHPFYAAYLNTAKQNVFIVLRDISEKLGLYFDTKVDDNMLKRSSEIWERLSKNDQPEITQKIIENLNDHFSFAKYLALNQAYNRTNKEIKEAQPEDYYQVFQVWVQQLLNYRNFYTHAVHDPVSMDAAITEGMRLLYDSDWKRFKERFSLNDDQTKHLLRLGKNGERINFHYGFTGSDGITEKGFLYFICLWLEKKDAQEFLKKHKGFKRGESKSERATLEKFTYFRTRIPKPRLTSDHSIQGLFLEMVNELKRCPKELYELLSKEDRQKFIPKEFLGEEYSSEGYQSIPELKRYGNRFYSFALRFLDNSFQHLKFQVDLGNYCFKSYEQTIEGIPRKRRWIKRMSAFGNLEDFDEYNRPREWKDKLEKLEDRGKLDTYITETTPHYHFDPESKTKVIGMKWFSDYKSELIWPEVGEKGKDLQPQGNAPDYWLSLYELPAMVFYQLLHENGLAKESAEKVVRNYYYRINGFLSKVKEGRISGGFTKEELKIELAKKSLRINDIPKVVVDHLTSTASLRFEERARMRLKEFKAENDQLLDKAKRQSIHYNKKPGSKDYVSMKSGKMADYLARDMLHLQKPTNQDEGKANSTEFQVLQAKLAFFGKNKETLVDTFKLCGLVDSENPHPFLYKIEIQRCRGILDFYLDYLRFGSAFLQQCLEQKEYSTYYFLKVKENDPKIGERIRRQQEAVMNLPRGLFTQPILHALNSSPETKDMATTFKNMERVNIAYIIQAYFEQIQKDSSQEFYVFKRSYELLNKLFDTRNSRDRSPLKKTFFSVEEMANMPMEIREKLDEKINCHIQKNRINAPEDRERIKKRFQKQYKRFTENEKQVRLYRICDLVTFLMIDKLYRKGDFLFDQKSPSGSELNVKYQLREVRPNAETSILSKQTEMKLPIAYPEKEKTYQKMIVHESLKIKKYGDFRAFLKDRRVIGMLAYIPFYELKYKAVKRELEEFQRMRLNVFEKILVFEKSVQEKVQLDKNEYGYISHDEFLDHIPDLSQEKKEQMEALRNMVCHSQYPSYDLFKYLIDGDELNQLAEYSVANKEVLNKSVIVQLEKCAIELYQEATELIFSIKNDV